MLKCATTNLKLIVVVETKRVELLTSCLQGRRSSQLSYAPISTLKNKQYKSNSFSLERRWSSRTFRYGYLVTTSPQSLILPSTAASISWLTGFGYPQLSWCDGRCVQGPGTYSRQYADLPLLAIPASWRRISAFNPNLDCFLGFAYHHWFASLCYSHCSTCVAQDIKGMMIWRRPHLPPIYHRQSL